MKALLQDPGAIDAFAAPGDVPPVIIGTGLLQQLFLYTGANVQLTGPSGARIFRVVGVFATRNSHLDQLAVAPFADVQYLRGEGDIAMAIEITLSNITRSTELAANSARRSAPSTRLGIGTRSVARCAS